MVKKIIIIFTVIFIIVGGIILINQLVFKDNGNDNPPNTNTNISTEEPKKDEQEEVELLEVASLNEISCELSSRTITEYGNIKKDYLKSEDGEVEINITSFDTKIQNTSIYNEETVKDGAIIFYYGSGKNYIEKFNMEGESSWKIETLPEYQFYDIIEKNDGYFMLGTASNKYVITKVDIKGTIINTKVIEEQITNILFIESEVNSYFKIAGINSEDRIVIVKYDNEINQQEAIKTKLRNVECDKIIEKDNNYYGIASDSTIAYERESTILFKVDNEGNELFKHDVVETFKEYIKSTSWLEDISVNHHYIYIVVANQEDVFALNLDGTLKKVFGYENNTTLNKGYHSDIDHVRAIDEGVLVYGKTAGQNIDMVSNEFNFKYRINITDTKLLPKTSVIKEISSSRLLESKYLDAELFDDTLLVIYQYKF